MVDVGAARLSIAGVFALFSLVLLLASAREVLALRRRRSRAGQGARAEDRVAPAADDAGRGPSRRGDWLSIVGDVGSAVATGGFAILLVYVSPHNAAAPDCTAYLTELATIQQHYPLSSAEAALSAFRADDLRRTCGDPVDIVDGLGRP